MSTAVAQRAAVLSFIDGFMAAACEAFEYMLLVALMQPLQFSGVFG